ncbi:unnamed protein product, partial [Mesorhabditis spiculigera]
MRYVLLLFWARHATGCIDLAGLLGGGSGGGCGCISSYPTAQVPIPNPAPPFFPPQFNNPIQQLSPAGTPPGYIPTPVISSDSSKEDPPETRVQLQPPGLILKGHIGNGVEPSGYDQAENEHVDRVIDAFDRELGKPRHTSSGYSSSYRHSVPRHEKIKAHKASLQVKTSGLKMAISELANRAQDLDEYEEADGPAEINTSTAYESTVLSNSVTTAAEVYENTEDSIGERVTEYDLEEETRRPAYHIVHGLTTVDPEPLPGLLIPEKATFYETIPTPPPWQPRWSTTEDSPTLPPILIDPDVKDSLSKTDPDIQPFELVTPSHTPLLTTPIVPSTHQPPDPGYNLFKDALELFKGKQKLEQNSQEDEKLLKDSVEEASTERYKITNYAITRGKDSFGVTGKPKEELHTLNTQKIESDMDVLGKVLAVLCLLAVALALPAPGKRETGPDRNVLQWFRPSRPIPSTFDAYEFNVGQLAGGQGWALFPSTNNFKLLRNKMEEDELTEEDHRSAPLFRLKSRRLHTMLMLMAGTAAMALLTTNIGITATCMVNSTALAYKASNETVVISTVRADNPKCYMDSASVVVDYGGELLWTEETQSLVKGAAFLGGIIAVMPGGMASDRYSATKLMLTSMGLGSFCNLLFPLVAQWNGPGLPVLAIILRFGMGVAEAFFLPAQNALMVRWIPLNEKATAGALYSIGYQIAGIIGVPMAAALCESSYRWPAVYYVSALVGLIWIIGFWYLAADTPASARWMGEHEVKYLRRELQHLNTGKQKTPFPWRSVLRSAAVWVLLYAFFAGNFVITFIQLYIPSFFKDVLLMNVRRNGFTTAIPHLCQIFAKFSWSTIIDRAKRHGLAPTAAVRLSQAVSCVGLVVGFASIATFADCERPWLAIFFLCLVTCSFGISVAGFICSLLSLAPAHVGMLTSLGNVIGFLGRWTCPMIVQHFKTVGTAAEWRQIFYAFSVIPLLSLVTFTFWASGR